MSIADQLSKVNKHVPVFFWFCGMIMIDGASQDNLGDSLAEETGVAF